MCLCVCRWMAVATIVYDTYGSVGTSANELEQEHTKCMRFLNFSQYCNLTENHLTQSYDPAGSYMYCGL
jgi:hypothetical protein